MKTTKKKQAIAHNRNQTKSPRKQYKYDLAACIINVTTHFGAAYTAEDFELAKDNLRAALEERGIE